MRDDTAPQLVYLRASGFDVRNDGNLISKNIEVPLNLSSVLGSASTFLGQSEGLKSIAHLMFACQASVV